MIKLEITMAVRNLQNGVEGCDSLDLAGSSCSTTRSTYKAFYLQLADIGLGQHHRAAANKSPPLGPARSDQRRPPRYSQVLSLTG